MIYLSSVCIWASLVVNVVAAINGDVRLAMIGMALLGIGMALLAARVMSMGRVPRR